MKNVAIALILFLCGQAGAQNWKSDLNTAIKEAAAAKKKVLLFFSVPEHCDSCAKLERNVFSTDEFNAYANANYVLVKIDFLHQSENLSEEMKQKNLLIVEKYNKDGFFPYVVILNKEAKIVGKTGAYKNETTREFLLVLESLNKV